MINLPGTKFLAMLAIMVVLLVFMLGAVQARVDGLFIPVEDIILEADIHNVEPKILRARYVLPDMQALIHADRTPGIGILPLNMFNDAVYSGIIHNVDENLSGSTTWSGHLDGLAFSSFILVCKGDVLLGTVKLPDALYRIVYIQDGVHAIYEIDSSTFPLELEPIPVDAVQGSATQNTWTADDGSVIDVLVVYTEAARVGLGGSTTAIETLIDIAVAETNAGYINSGVNQEIRLMYTEEVPYSEVDFKWDTTVIRLQNPSDGYMDTVHALRDSTCADLVVLLVDNSSSCGIAYVMGTLSPDFEDNAFSVVSTNCATGYYSFGHEMGHNMGSAHDRANASILGVYNYSFGYQDPLPNQAFRTIMAYDCPGSCPRLNYWSNPEKLMYGRPMGVFYTDPLAADNRRSLNITALTVSNFRDSGICNPATHDISGQVLDSSGLGINGVTVDFDGARPAVATNGDGYYTQSGFGDGSYNLSFSKSAHLFRPSEALVNVSDSDAVQNSTGYPAVGLPFSDGFESGVLGNSWIEETDNEGRVRVDSLFPNQGSYSLLLDDAVGENSIYSHASASLHLDLSSSLDVVLSFWWREFNDEDHPDDGVFISDDDGETWHQASSFLGSTDIYTHTVLDLDLAASDAGMDFNDHFLVKFQFYDNYPIDAYPDPADGYAIDDVWVGPQVGPLVYEAHTVNDNDIEDSRGDNDGVAECGEIIELFVDLTNQGVGTAHAITATLSTTDTYVSFLYNTASIYPDILGSATTSNSNDFDIAVSHQIPDGHMIPFVLEITALNGGPWVDYFNLIAGCSKVYIPHVNK